MKVFFLFFALISVSRGVYTPKKWMSIFTFIDGFPIKLIVFCRSPPGICAVSTKKTRCLVSLWETGFPCSRDELPLLAIVILFLHFWFPSLIRASHRALSFHFGNTSITERSIPVVLTAYVGGFLSINSALHPTVCIPQRAWPSLPPKQVSKSFREVLRDRACT